MDTDEHRLNKITETILGVSFAISNGLGCGFLEKVYENALAKGIQKKGLNAKQQHPIKISYDGDVVGDYIADILVEDLVIIEVKAVKALEDIHSAQCINYLKATGKPVCLLLNFGKPRLEYKRFRL